MKAIILERRGDIAAVLCEDGTIEKRRVSGAVGESVELPARTVAFPAAKRWLRGAVAAALALAVTGGALGYLGGTASAYVSLDVEDAAIELEVNHFGRVIAVNALNGDAEALAERLSGEIRHRTAKDALDQTMGRLRDEGYLDDADEMVVVGVASDNGRRAAALVKNAEDAAEGRLLAVTESSRAERELAREQQISVGRFGFERDHGKMPDGMRQAVGQENQPIGAKEPKREVEPAVPASGAAVAEQEAMPAGERQSDPTGSEAPLDGETHRNAPRQGGTGPAPQNEPRQNGPERRETEQEQSGERPTAGQGRSSEHEPEREAPTEQEASPEQEAPQERETPTEGETQTEREAPQEQEAPQERETPQEQEAPPENDAVPQSAPAGEMDRGGGTEAAHGVTDLPKDDQNGV